MSLQSKNDKKKFVKKSSFFHAITKKLYLGSRKNITFLYFNFRGILVQDLFAPHGVQVNTPTTMRGKNQLPSDVVVKDRRISSLRVHIERVIGYAKTYKILKTDLPHDYVPIAGRILFVAFAICNFRPSIMNN